MKKGVISLLLLGIVAVLLLLGIFIFGPWDLPGFGQLSQRQQGQESLAAEGFWPPPGDSDQDGFTDVVEKWIKTDVADNCADDADDAAWPPDINNDKKVTQADIDVFGPHMGSSLGRKNYDKRFDLDANKVINVTDILKLSPYMNASCPFHFLKATPSVQSVAFNWTPALEARNGIRVFDMTNTNQTNCDFNGLASWGFLVDAPDAGSTSYTWKTNPAPISGHKYCSAIGDGQFYNSRFVEFSIPPPPPPPPPPSSSPTP